MNDKKLYIAGMGMITALGPSVATTVAAVRAGKSAYQLSEYETLQEDPIIMAKVPDRVFEHICCEIEEEGSVFNYRHERMIRMGIVALKESVSQSKVNEAVPFILALPEDYRIDEGKTPFIPALENNLKPWIKSQLSRKICTGRSAGLEALDFAFNYLLDQSHDYLLVLGVDSFLDESVLLQYKDRLLTHSASDAFAPGEGACALLLTSNIELADNREGYVIAISRPGIAEEEGHLSSDLPYRGNGLDHAFKLALKNQEAKSISLIYSCMNGENYWAKEYGVAYLRNKEKFMDHISIKHPADCYGDIGAATGTSLISLSVEECFIKKSFPTAHLVYSSSDNGKRGALVIQKIIATCKF